MRISTGMIVTYLPKLAFGKPTVALHTRVCKKEEQLARNIILIINKALHLIKYSLVREASTFQSTLEFQARRRT
jgi:hypothetical protein